MSQKPSRQEAVPIKRISIRILIYLLLALLTVLPLSALGEGSEAFTDVAVFSTTDMHGKCWHTNLLTDAPETNNMLAVSSAVRQFREAYGEERVILIDNGDLFQGTPVSEVQLQARAIGESADPPVMALCLTEIGYDAFVPGNHEFNYDWPLMSGVYQYLEDSGVPVVAANIVRDGTDGVHPAGENVFTPWITKTVTVNGHEHKIGILGLESSDVPRWDLPEKYPGLMFAHPGNENRSMAQEVQLYLPAMREAGCEFIIVSYHGGLGGADRPLVFGTNSESQGLRMIQETGEIDLLILGHDHTSGYSDTYHKDASGKEVLVVNGGGQQLTQTVIRFREEESGALAWEFLSSQNLKLDQYDPDPELEAKVAPYAALAGEAVNSPLGTAAGEWDGLTEFYTRQTHTIDLIAAASISVPSRRLQARYKDAAELGIQGLDHLDVDMAITSNAVSNGYVIRPGSLSMRDIYRLYRFSNTLFILPMTGGQIRSVLEENASARLRARVHGGEVYFYHVGDNFTHLLFGGINFVYDLSKPEGQRVVISGFANGRPFTEDGVYLVTVNNYLLRNEGCGLRSYSSADAVWAQGEDEAVQHIIASYVLKCCEEDGELTPDRFPWRWSITWSGDPAALQPREGEAAATLRSTPEEGGTYVILEEAEGLALGTQPLGSGFATVACEIRGDALCAPLSGEAQRFTVKMREDGGMTLVNEDGLYLTGAAGGGLILAPEPAEGDLSLWTLQPAYGGWNVVCAGLSESAPVGLEFYRDHISTYAVSGTSNFVFNFYQPEDD